MDLVIINESTTHRLAFFLALEEFLARKFTDRDFFFAWQVEPTVIVGRNQLISKEVDIEYCRNTGIDIVRRKSGGGAVLADKNNIMFSYVTSSDDVCATFGHYTAIVAESLRKLGLNATDNSRNDILIDSKKVSGNSYYHIPGRSIVHGTMLYDYDPVMMSKALSPSSVKLASHGVTSTRSRVTTIKEHIAGLSIEEFKNHILKTVPDGNDPLYLESDDLREIESIEQSYYNESWINGKNPKGNISSSSYIEGVGEINVNINLKSGRIDSFMLFGDYLENIDAQKEFAETLIGVYYTRENVASAIKNMDFPAIIPGLSSDKFLNLIF